MTVSEAVAELMATARVERATSFRALTAECQTRIEVIVRFLALLELCKLGRVTLGPGRDLRGPAHLLAHGGATGDADAAAGLGELAGYEIDDYEG